VAQSLVVQIDNEVQKKQTATYSNGVSSSYTLTLSVPVKIFRNKKILLSKTLTASTTIGKLPTTQADRLQIDTNYLQLRNIVVTKLLRRLRYLDEN
jgi:LPS-assembly lipoprotein